METTTTTLRQLWGRVVFEKGEEAALCFGSSSSLSFIEIHERALELASCLALQHGVGGVNINTVSSSEQEVESVLLVINNDDDDNKKKVVEEDVKCPFVAEIVAVIALGIRLQVPWVAVRLGRDELERKVTFLRDVVKKTKARTAIMVSENFSGKGDEDPVIQFLANECGVHRAVVLDALDGSILNGVSPSALSSLEENEEDEQEQATNRCLYHICTSGSTGEPKIVSLTEIGLLDRLEWQWTIFPWDEEQEEMQCRRTPLSFVDSTAEIFGALLQGVPLYLPSSHEVMKGGLLKFADESLFREKVTRITLLPSQLASALRARPDLLSECESLRIVTVSGSETTPEIVEIFKRSSKQRKLQQPILLNVYGSSEVSADVMYAILHGPEMENKEVVSGAISVPIWSGCELIGSTTEFQIDCLESETGDRVGELLISGNCLAIGYAGNEQETKARFVTLGNKRFFRTGDIVRQDSQTKFIYYIGRKDNQVKIRGQRVEMEDVARRISSILGLTTPVLVFHTAKFISGGIIVAVLSSWDSSASPGANLRDQLRGKMDDAMIPAFVLCPPADYVLPVSSSGKFDLQKLKHDFDNGDLFANFLKLSPDKVSHSQISQIVVCLVRETLGDFMNDKGDAFILEHRFEELGGDSMLGTEFAWRFFKKTNISIDPKLFFQGSLTLGELVKTLEGNSISSVSISKDTSNIEGDTAAVKQQSTSLWSTKLRMCVDASPILVMAKNEAAAVFVGSQGGDFVRIDPIKGGEIVWSIDLTGSIENAAAYHPILDILYVSSFLPQTGTSKNEEDESPSKKNKTMRGRAYAISPLDGKIIWELSLDGETKASPTLDIVNNQLWLACDHARLYCLDCKDGQLLKKIDLPGPVYASVALLHITQEESTSLVCAATTTGRLLCFSSRSQEEINLEWDIDLQAPIYSQPQVSPTNDTFVIGNMNGEVLAISTKSGDRIWNFESGHKNIFSKCQITGNVQQLGYLVICASQDGWVFALDLDSGTEIWSVHLTNSVIYSSPLVISTERVIICTTSGQIVEISKPKTRLLARLNAEIFSTPVLFSNDTLVVGSRDDYCHAIALI